MQEEEDLSIDSAVDWGCVLLRSMLASGNEGLGSEEAWEAGRHPALLRWLLLAITMTSQAWHVNCVATLLFRSTFNNQKQFEQFRFLCLISFPFEIYSISTSIWLELGHWIWKIAIEEGMRDLRVLNLRKNKTGIGMNAPQGRLKISCWQSVCLYVCHHLTFDTKSRLCLTSDLWSDCGDACCLLNTRYAACCQACIQTS